MMKVFNAVLSILLVSGSAQAKVSTTCTIQPNLNVANTFRGNSIEVFEDGGQYFSVRGVIYLSSNGSRNTLNFKRGQASTGEVINLQSSDEKIDGVVLVRNSEKREGTLIVTSQLDLFHSTSAVSSDAIDFACP